MTSEIIFVAVVVALLLVIAAMVRQRGSAKTVQHQSGGSPELWRTAAPRSAPGSPVPDIVLPPRDHEAAAKAVIAHLRLLEERASPGLTAQVLPVFLKDTAA